MQTRSCVWSVVCALAVLIGSSAAAQTNTGQIGGTIRDSQGGVCPASMSL